MKNLFTLVLVLMCSAFMYGQGSISGTILDTDNNESLIGASVVIKGTTIGTVTDVDGKFTLSNIEEGAHTLIISYIGYEEMMKEVTVGSGNLDIGSVSVGQSAFGLDEINVVANVAIDRKTPVAVSTISGSEIELKIGNNEFTDILKSTPSVYATRSGGGYGDGRINVRGFDQRNIAVMINGIPVNDMENGWVYWSNWAGLADVARDVQIQRGLGASKLAINSVGGTINVLTKTTDMRKGGSAGLMVGNDGFLKANLTLSSGRLESGWAFTFSGSKTVGNGYIDGAYIDAYSYFASIAKEFGDNHQLSFTAIGAPQKHGQRSFRENLTKYVANDNGEDYEELIANSSVSDFDERIDMNGEKVSPAGNVRYNSDWGFKDGERFNMRENFYHKPQLALNHYWDVSDNFFLGTSAYYSLGRGGGTGSRGSIDGSGEWAYRDDNGLLRMDDIASWNTGVDAGNLTDADGGKFQTTDGFIATERDGLIKRASMNEHNWFGILSTANVDLTDQLNLVGGIDLRGYTGLHYRKVIDLLGNDGWLESRDVNNQSYSIDANGDGEVDSKETGNLITEGDDNLFGNPGQDSKVNYDNDGKVGWQGVFAYLEYDNDKFSVVGGGSVSNTNYTRVDRFNYLEGSENETSDRYSFFGYNAKVGANFNIDDANNIFVNAGALSIAPTFDNIFPNFNNIDVNENAENEDVLSFELGYGFRSGSFDAKLNGYWTNWKNKTFRVRGQDDVTGEDFFANILGVDALHTGIEIEANVEIASGFKLGGMASFGNWAWQNNVSANIVDDNNIIVETVDVFLEDVKVGDAAQTTLGLRAEYKMPFGLSVDAEYQHFDNLYANFDPTRRNSLVDDAAVQPLELPSYGLVNAGLTYAFDVAGLGARLRLNGYNLLDELYVAEANDVGVGETLQDASGFFGWGRTWTLGLKVTF